MSKFPIVNGASKPLSKFSPTLPNVADVLNDWFQTITFVKIVKTVVNFAVVEKRIEIVFQGVVEDQDPTNLQMNSNGQRRWDDIQVWTHIDLELNVDDQFEYDRCIYRITQKQGWDKYGYFNYQAIQDYKSE